MTSDFSALNALIRQDPIFWFSALSGSLLFVIQFFLNFLEGDNHHDVDDGGGAVDSGKVKWLSKQGITGFLMMFGWVGLTCKKEFGFSTAPTILVAFAGGVLAIFVTTLIFKAAKRLRSSGTVFKIEDAIGKEAVVYQRILKGGVGKISLSLHDLTYEVDAVSQQQEELASFTQVQIIKKLDEKTVVVVPKYTESDSRVGSCQGGARNLSQAQPASKQLNFLSLAMQMGHKFRGCPTLAEPILQSRAV